MFDGMASMFYGMHYRESISPHLTRAQKEGVAKRISELTLKPAVWPDNDKCYKEDFPEIAGYVNVALTGLYLCTILKEIVAELAGAENALYYSGSLYEKQKKQEV